MARCHPILWYVCFINCIKLLLFCIVYYNNIYFFLLAGSHTAEAITTHVNTIATKFLGVPDLSQSHWRPPITTDGAANIAKAID